MLGARVGGFAGAACLVLFLGCSDDRELDASAASHSDASLGDAGAAADPCPHGRLEGSYAITTAEDRASIEACTEITGDLSVSGDMVTHLSLPRLEVIGGALHVMEASALASFEFSALATIGTELTVDTNAVLSAFSLPVLSSSATLLITNNPELRDFELDALTEVNFLGLQSDDALTTFELPKLESVGVFVVTLNAGLTTVRFDSLATITTDGFIITKNPVLDALDLPVLRTLIGDILIQENPMLPSCQIDALVAQIEGPSVPISDFGNNDAATCP